jgi:hypothetical protein
MVNGEEPRLVPLRERSRLTGENVDSLRAAAQDGRLPGARHDNRGRWLVPLPDDAPPRAAQGEVVDLLKDELAQVRADQDQVAQERDAARAEADRWRVLAEDERVTVAELRTQVTGKAELVEELRRQLDRLEAEVVELRTPLLARLLAMWRR